MYVCSSGLGGNIIFSAPNKDRGLISSSFTTYGCCHPCLNLYFGNIFVAKYLNKLIAGGSISATYAILVEAKLFL